MLRYVIVLISAGMLVLAQPSFNIEPLAWIALAGLFYSLDGLGPWKRFLVGYLFGAAYFLGIAYWLAHVSILGTIILIIYLSIYPAFFSLYKIKGDLIEIISVPAFWVISEYFRAHVISGFPWALLGHTQYLNIPAIQIADITGAYGVSFVVVMVNYAVYSMLKKYDARIKHSIFCLTILIFVFLYGYISLREPDVKNNRDNFPLKIAVLQGNIPQDLKWDEDYSEFILDTYEKLAIEASMEDPDIIIWPETSVPGTIEEDYIYRKIKPLSEKTGKIFLIGSLKERGGKFYNSAYLVSPVGEIGSSYDKVHLVPFGEFVPMEKELPFLRSMIDKPMGDFERGASFNTLRMSAVRKSYSENAIIRNRGFYNFGVMICFEDIFPEIGREFVRGGAQFLVNITNDAWFKISSAPYQHVQSSVFRAVENRVPVIRAANTGVSCAINDKGRIISLLEKNGKDIFVSGYNISFIEPPSVRSFYTIKGDMFVALCGALVIGAIVMRLRRRKVKVEAEVGGKGK